MDIFESLENLNISEECFDEIMDIVEAMLKDRMTMGELRKVGDTAVGQRKAAYLQYKSKYGEEHPKTFKSKLRLNYAQNLVGKNDSKSTKKYPDNMTVGDAKKKAGYNAGIPTGERPKYREYSSDASKQAQYELSQDAEHSRELQNRSRQATPTDYAIYSAGRSGLKPMKATDREAEIANRNAKREERKRKEEMSRWREDVRSNLRRGR